MQSRSLLLGIGMVFSAHWLFWQHGMLLLCWPAKGKEMRKRSPKLPLGKSARNAPA